jgi:thiol:disulfide interchange protein DsbA
MRFIQHAFLALGLSVAAFAAGASPANPQNGVDYRTLEQQQQTDSQGKVEVTEFFWYACPHCFALEKPLEAWVKKQGDNIVFKRVPVSFRPSFVPQQKLYYTLEALGKVDELHQKVFNAIHIERKRLDTDEAVAEFIAKQDIDQKKFRDVYNSFAVQTKVRRASQLQDAYRVDGVPLLAVGGRYMTSPAMISQSVKSNADAVLHGGTMQVLDWLVARVAKENGAQAAKQ